MLRYILEKNLLLCPLPREFVWQRTPLVTTVTGAKDIQMPLAVDVTLDGIKLELGRRCDCQRIIALFLGNQWGIGDTEVFLAVLNARGRNMFYR